MAIGSYAQGSICFQVGSFKALYLSLNNGNLMHYSIFPNSFSSSLAQKIHSGGNSCMAEDDGGL